jgi:hypothetical protein
LKITKKLIQVRENKKNCFHRIFELALAESEKSEVPLIEKEKTVEFPYKIFPQKLSI